MEGKDCEMKNDTVSNQEEHNLPPRSKKSSHTSSEMASGYDPSRIPSAIFGDKPSTPTEWSAASSESLFSINAANYSFSVIKSGELSMINKSLADHKPEEKPVPLDETITITSPPVTQVVSQGDMDKNIRASGDLAQSTDKVVCRTNGELSSCISVHSNDSHTSTRSFAFPVLGAQNGHGVSAKVCLEEEKQQQELQSEADPQTTSSEAPNQAWCSWFSYFSCCRFC